MDDQLPALPEGFTLDGATTPAPVAPVRAPAVAATPQQPQQPVSHDIPGLPAGFALDDHPATAPEPAPERFGSTEALGSPVSVAADNAKKWEAARADIATILNGPGSTAEVRARLADRLARDGGSLHDLGDIETTLAYREKNPGIAIPVGVKVPDAAVIPDKQPEHDSGDGAIGAFGRAASDALTLGGARWIHGLGAAVGQTLLGDEHSILDQMSSGRRDWDARENYDWNNHPIAYGAGELAGSLALPVGAEARIAGRLIPSAVGRIAMGAGQAGAMGFLHGEQSLGDRLKNGAEAAATGAAIGGALEGGAATVSRLLRGDSVARQAAQDTYDAAGRLNTTAGAGDALIAPLPAHIGGPAVRGATSALKHTIIAGGGIESGLHDFVGATQGARDRIADAVSPGVSTMDRDAIGTKLASDTDPAGLQQWEDRWKAANDKNYKRAIWLSNDAKVTTPNTIGALDRRISELSGAPGNPHTAAIAKLQSLRDDLASNQYGVEKLRLTRSDWGKSVDSSDGVLRGMAKTLYGTLSQDIDTGLRAQGHVGAAQHWSKADKAYAEGLDFLRNDLPTILGKNGDADADRVLSNVEGLIRQGKTSTLTRVLGQAPAEVAAKMRGQIISGLGRTVLDPASGKVGFSAPMFIRQWDKLSTTAKTSLFDPATISALNDVRTVAGAAVRSGIADNTSKTAATAENQRVLRSVVDIVTNLPHAFVHGVTGGGALLMHLGTEAGIGYLLSKPGVARAIAGVQKGTPNAQQVLQRRIAGALARTPKKLLTLPATANGIASTGDDGQRVPGLTINPSAAPTVDPSLAGMTPEQFVARDAPGPQDFEQPDEPQAQ